VGVVNTGYTVVVGVTGTPAFAAVVAVGVDWEVASDSTVVGVALTNSELVAMCVRNAANTVGGSWAGASTETLGVTVAWCREGLLSIVLAAFSAPVGIACAISVVITRGVIGTVDAFVGVGPVQP
jgi:hypothetical protein